MGIPLVSYLPSLFIDLFVCFLYYFTIYTKLSIKIPHVVSVNFSQYKLIPCPYNLSY